MVFALFRWLLRRIARYFYTALWSYFFVWSCSKFKTVICKKANIFCPWRDKHILRHLVNRITVLRSCSKEFSEITVLFIIPSLSVFSSSAALIVKKKSTANQFLIEMAFFIVSECVFVWHLTHLQKLLSRNSKKDWQNWSINHGLCFLWTERLIIQNAVMFLIFFIQRRRQMPYSTCAKTSTKVFKQMQKSVYTNSWKRYCRKLLRVNYFSI